MIKIIYTGQYIRKGNSRMICGYSDTDCCYFVTMERGYTNSRGGNGKSSRTPRRYVTGVSDSDISTSYYIIHDISFFPTILCRNLEIRGILS